jgi:hypothetical protein
MIAIKNLANGQLGTSKATLYSVPVGSEAIALNVIVVNIDTSARSYNLYLKESAGTSRNLVALNGSIGASSRQVMNDKVTLGPGDEIEGDATAGAVVSFVINGAERTP